MSVTSLTRTIAVGTAACALALAGGASAGAAPFNAGSAHDGARVPAASGRLYTAGTDVAAPDQQSPIPADGPPVAQGAPTWPTHPATLTRPQPAAPSAAEGFQWDDAGIGAGGALAVVIAGLGGVLLRRRHVPGVHPAT